MEEEKLNAFCGLYINLDRSPDRREAIERQLTALGLQRSYSRFPAVDGRNLTVNNGKLTPGELAIFQSHYGALSHAKATGLCAHIVEDDALLSQHVPLVIHDAIATKVFDHFDLLFTDMMVPCHIESLKELRKKFDKVAGLPKPVRLRDLTLLDLKNFTAPLHLMWSEKNRLTACCHSTLQSLSAVPIFPLTSLFNNRFSLAHCALRAHSRLSPARGLIICSRQRKTRGTLLTRRHL
jgi:hypothetical protein